MCHKFFVCVLLVLSVFKEFSFCKNVRTIEIVEDEFGYFKTRMNHTGHGSVLKFNFHKSVDRETASTKRYIAFIQTNVSVFPNNLFEIFPTAKHIDFNNCEVEIIGKSNFMNGENLTTLNLISNKIHVLPSEVFIHLSGLKTLHLHDNEISEIDLNAFQGLANLQIINLSGNKIKTISGQHFRSLVKLENLLLKSNPIDVLHEDFLQHLPHLRQIDLSECQIHEIDPNVFLHLKNLRILGIGYNSFQRLYLPSLDILLAQNSNIQICNILGNVTKLVLKNNRLQSVAVTDMSKLTEIDVENNSISDIRHLTRAKNLVILNLNGNPVDQNNLSDEVFSNFPNLIQLQLARMNISFLDVNILKNLKNLETLDLSGNQITYLDVKQFDILPKLHKIIINDNKLTEIRFGF